MSAPDGVGCMKKHARKEGFWFQMELNFGQKEDKDHFIFRLDRVKGSLATKRRWPVDNIKLLSHLLDLAEEEDSEFSHTTQFGHMICAEFQCQSCNRKEWWASSSLLGSRYLINQKLIHAFTCAGMLLSHYYHFCRLASLGTVGKSVFTIVYTSKGCIAAIESCAKASMMKAIDEIKSTLDCQTNGE
uniref:Uncharacterized protein n=1 Tax=Amphimedon queenslandica TaxID=400682 RepID=A0A1X7TFP4_AMPQE